MEILSQQAHQSKEAVSRTLVKTITYRVFILLLDFITVYLFTRQAKIAFGFMIASNIYTTIGYFLHERIWDKIKWGKKIYKHTEGE